MGTVQTTPNEETIFITLNPNFCMAIKVLHLKDNLKVQIQNTGTPHIHTTYAVIHCQMVYRLHNHACDVAISNVQLHYAHVPKKSHDKNFSN